MCVWRGVEGVCVCEGGCGGGSTDMMELTLSIKMLCLHERLNT